MLPTSDKRPFTFKRIKFTKPSLAFLPFSIEFFCYCHRFLCIYFQFAGSQFFQFLHWEEPENPKGLVDNSEQWVKHLFKALFREINPRVQTYHSVQGQGPPFALWLAHNINNSRYWILNRVNKTHISFRSLHKLFFKSLEQDRYRECLAESGLCNCLQAFLPPYTSGKEPGTLCDWRAGSSSSWRPRCHLHGCGSLWWKTELADRGATKWKYHKGTWKPSSSAQWSWQRKRKPPLQHFVFVAPMVFLSIHIKPSKMEPRTMFPQTYP